MKHGITRTFSEKVYVYKIAVRANWADPFIGNYRTRINNAISTYLGSGPKKDLLLATLGFSAHYLAVQKKVRKDLQEELKKPHSLGDESGNWRRSHINKLSETKTGRKPLTL